MFFTIDHNSGGYHGHQIKDSLGARTIGELFGLKYLHTPYAYLDDFGIGRSHDRLRKWRRNFKFKTIRRISGPLWDGIADFKAAQEYFSEALDIQDDKCLLRFDKALRIHPFQTIPWHNDGMIKESIFDKLAREYTDNFAGLYPRETSKEYTVAIHISRGVDFNTEKFPEHFKDSSKVRYMFPLEYFENIIKQIKSFNPNAIFTVYTEELNSSEIIARFSTIENVEISVGSNRKEKNQALIKDIFRAFVASDILVTCNSSFSAMCSYFRYGKKTIYHPHRHLNHLPLPFYIATDDEGNFNQDLLK